MAEMNINSFIDNLMNVKDSIAQIISGTLNQLKLPHFDWGILYANKIVLGTVSVVALIFIISLIKATSKSKPKQILPKPMASSKLKSQIESPTLTVKQEKKIKLNYATPATLNSCIRVFLERTKNR